MFRFKELLEQNKDKICQLIGEEHGKIPHDAMGELQRGIENVEYACTAPEVLKGEFSKNDSSDFCGADGVRAVRCLGAEAQNGFGDEEEEHGKKEQAPCFGRAFAITVFSGLVEQRMAGAFEQQIDVFVVQ